MPSSAVNVTEKVRQKTFRYKTEDILSYTLKYPELHLGEEYYGNSQRDNNNDLKYQVTKKEQFLNRLNLFYRIRTFMYEKNKISELYQMAISDYENSIANGYPVRKYEAYTDYTVTYNADDILSLYFDLYEYTGGAHGMTYRTSDNWDLNSGSRISLEDLFPGMPDYEEYIMNTIIQQIDADMASGNQMYFEDYEQLVRESFDSNQFYLTEEGVVLFFNLYDIAPYAAGMPTFIIPYGESGATLPKSK